MTDEIDSARREVSVFDYGDRILLEAYSPDRGGSLAVLSEDFVWLADSASDATLGEQLLALVSRVPPYDGDIDEFDPKPILKAMGFGSFRQQAKKARSVHVVVDFVPILTVSLHTTHRASGEFVVTGGSERQVEHSDPQSIGNAVRRLLASSA